MLRKTKFWSLFTILLSLIPVVIMPFIEKMAGGELYIYITYSAFYYILAFIIFLLAYKRIDSLKKITEYTKLLSWELPKDQNDKKKFSLKDIIIKKLLFLLACDLLFFVIFVYLIKIEFIFGIGVFLSAYLYLSAMILYLSVIEYIKNGEGKIFMLCHNALLISGIKIPLDGKKNAIYEVNYDADKHLLILGLLRGRQQGHLNIPVPEDEITNVHNFIVDLNKHFDQLKEKNGNKTEGN